MRLLLALLLLASACLGAPRTIVCFGDSLTAGYGLSPEQAWPALLQERLDARDGPGAWRVVNAGLSGETTSGGLRRLAWVLRGDVDIFILALGANDGLRGQPVDRMERNLAEMLQRVRTSHPQARLVLAGMMMPLNLGEDYTRSFAAAFPKVAGEAGATLIPFLLDGVATVPELNLGDQIHPNENGQKRVLETVWKTLAPLATP
jgi:acyl-CoA thioesterase-1